MMEDIEESKLHVSFGCARGFENKNGEYHDIQYDGSFSDQGKVVVLTIMETSSVFASDNDSGEPTSQVKSGFEIPFHRNEWRTFAVQTLVAMGYNVTLTKVPE